jgi:HAE1 family hydrophobic/amphiphilic exporter-1
LIGTFAFIKVFGFSINSLTLFGITLATGLVVDDAIVVIENVQRHIAMEHSDPHEATSRAMGEVTSAVIATSLVLIAVFVPVSFFPGTTGHSLPAVLADHRLRHRHLGLQRAYAFAGAVGHVPARRRGSPQSVGLPAHPPGLKRLCRLHSRGRQRLSLAGQHLRQIHSCRAETALPAAAGLFFAGLGATVWIYQHVPTGFIPQEDQSFLMVIVQAPPGSSLAYTTALADRASQPSSLRIPTLRRLLHHGLQLFRRALPTPA